MDSKFLIEAMGLDESINYVEAVNDLKKEFANRLPNGIAKIKKVDFDESTNILTVVGFSLNKHAGDYAAQIFQDFVESTLHYFGFGPKSGSYDIMNDVYCYPYNKHNGTEITLKFTF